MLRDNLTALFQIPVHSPPGNYLVKLYDCSLAWSAQIRIRGSWIRQETVSQLGNNLLMTQKGIAASAVIYMK